MNRSVLCATILTLASLSCSVENVYASMLSLPCTNLDTFCGYPAVQPASSRIVGGQEAQIGAWPWLVSLVELGYHSCGGAIINERFILTATHCLTGKSDDPKRWQVVAGKHNLLRIEQGQQAVKNSQELVRCDCAVTISSGIPEGNTCFQQYQDVIKKIIFHENYDNKTEVNDIALLLLDESLNFTTLVRPVCLPAAGQGVTTGETCLLAGWGRTKGTGNANLLNQVDLPIIADSVCSQPDWYGSDFIPATTFCAGYEAGGKDGCTGDSGGPLICRRGDRWFAQGVSSWGYDCAEYKWPGIYTDVSMYTDWITANVAEHIKCDTVG